MNKKYIRFGRYINFAFSFGFTSLVSIFLGFWGGQWLDGKLGTSPVFLLVGVFLGIGMSFASLMQELKSLNRLEKNLGGEDKDQKNRGRD